MRCWIKSSYLVFSSLVFFSRLSGIHGLVCFTDQFWRCYLVLLCSCELGLPIRKGLLGERVFFSGVICTLVFQYWLPLCILFCSAPVLLPGIELLCF
jgi:hypothetical protein